MLSRSFALPLPDSSRIFSNGRVSALLGDDTIRFLPGCGMHPLDSGPLQSLPARFMIPVCVVVLVTAAWKT